MSTTHAGVEVVGTTSMALAPDTPTTASAALAELDGLELGIWEVAPGIEHDVEDDELFVVLTGRATITVDGQGSVDVGPGDVVRLTEGTSTTWTVHEALRKLYLVAADAPGAA
jgi:uncharacterized cupin superfamily protein